MSLALTGTQYLTNANPPVLDYPMTVATWVRPAAAGNVFRSIWQLSRHLDAQDRFALYQWTGSVWNALVSKTSADTSCTGGTVTALQWHFVVARFISATNRRIDVLNASSSTAHAQNTTSVAPTIIADLTIGADPNGADAFSGQFAEMWYTNTDIQPDGAALSDITLRHLAYNGPFSMPYIAKDIVEYRSFLSSAGSRDVEPGEVFWGSRGKQVWDTTGTPTVGLHVPLLLPTYRRPTDYHRMLMI